MVAIPLVTAPPTKSMIVDCAELLNEGSIVSLATYQLPHGIPPLLHNDHFPSYRHQTNYHHLRRADGYPQASKAIVAVCTL